MLSASLHYSRQPEGVRAIDQVTERLQGLDSDHHLLILVVSPLHRAQLPAMLARLRSISGIEDIVGGESFGTILENTELEDGPFVALMHLRSTSPIGSTKGFEQLVARDAERGAELAAWAKQQGAKGVLAFVDGMAFDPLQFFQGYLKTGQAALFGGGTSANTGERKSHQWVGEQALRESLVALAFASDLHFVLGVSQSCKPLTAPKIIEEVDGQIIRRISGETPLKWFMEEMKAPLLAAPERIPNSVFAAIGAPEEPGFASGAYSVINLLGFDQLTGAMKLPVEVKPGAQFSFAMRNPFAARDDLKIMLEGVREQLAGQTPAFGFYFNCIARGKRFFGVADHDVAYIRSVLGDFPLLGMMSNGEIASLNQAPHHFMFAGVLALAVRTQ